ncbi:MAG: CPBP family glutamic-type intramembrane protease [Dermatophilaceae bacterium]
MIRTTLRRLSAPPTRLVDPTPSPSTRHLVIFAAAAVGVGGSLLTLSTLIQPDAPLLIAAVLFGLALPALLLTYREAGAPGVEALLRDCVRPPSSWWWLPLAGFGLPVATWITGAALGGAQPLSWGLIGFYAVDLAAGALIINIWEEMAWTGFFQRRVASRWGLIGGGLVTAVFFTAIHIPLALRAADTAAETATSLLYLAAAAIGIRLLIARIDPWSGRSVLVVGVLHSGFNATETVLEPAFFWVRIVVTIGLGIGVVAFARQPHPPI